MKKSLCIAAIAAFIFTGCSQRIVGTWNVDKYEVNNQKGQNLTTTNAGKITFNKNGTGEKKIEYSIFSNDYSDARPFTWKLQDSNLTITGMKNDKKSDFDKTWIIVTDKGDRQVWKSTDGSNTVQVLQLTKD
ncbi:lipocalin family protein [Gillisia sp. M10.2A]|uniref:Lipocalin family protein n=1 Tax=Gillisia lutea TaxID=2909668 RepID=A0ABS9EHY4_9FLAO|nr:lipocalin family protein [Gillisia lutea]MCF4101784.1 lipocalin family protein [Gillisia lutea]